MEDKIQIFEKKYPEQKKQLKKTRNNIKHGQTAYYTIYIM